MTIVHIVDIYGRYHHISREDFADTVRYHTLIPLRSRSGRKMSELPARDPRGIFYIHRDNIAGMTVPVSAQGGVYAAQPEEEFNV